MGENEAMVLTQKNDPVLMTQTMRWFGPADPVSLRDIRQAGASEVVTALHDIPNGMVWDRPAIAARRAEITRAGLGWSVVESLPVHESIKLGAPDCDRYLAAYRESLRHLAAEGVRVVTYNFMPLLDWTRTDLRYEMPDGALALRFEPVALAAYDIYILRRPDAARDYDEATCAAAERRVHAMDAAARLELEQTIIAGLPGSEESFTSAELLRAVEQYGDVGADRLREHHAAFLEAVCPVAEEVGIRLVVHPDDPPFPIFGLPRVVSTEADVAAIFARVPSVANGLCFCAGSFGARQDNDLPGMVERLQDRIGFVHLRSVQHEPDGSFHEAAHLEGDARMAEIVAALYNIQQRSGRSIPMRPDHGHQMMYDLTRTTNPGYSLIGRMRGLAELRGLERGIAHAAAAA
ncbi:mannonate dehydratase [Sphingomonas crusticola]|uniref:mannonate dehydratase n=1 Tax=Sphingomonas crusticola TaxID=1697973 RepID=UPI001F07E636|nr:mannonate dehydratase [Sphingomonas crusticola]